MQTVILAGGLGTRLRPLTYTTPKPLLPILNEPMIERLIKSLPREIDKVVLAVSYMFERLKIHFDEHDVGREVVLVEEKEPLGTGGAIKNIESQLDSTFIVFNGDVISSLDVLAMMDFHVKSGGMGTISMWEVEDPTRYGIVDTDAGSKISRFHEKPSPEDIFSNWINAGVYVLEPEILGLMKANKVISIEREIFPPLAEEGKLYGFKFRGYWLDAGTPEAYLQAHRILLDEGKSRNSPDLEVEAKINPPVLVGENCRIAAGSELGPYTCLGNDIEVLEGTRTSNSVVLDAVKIGRNNRLEECIVGYGCRIEDDVGLGKGLVIGDNQVLKKGMEVESYSKIGMK